MLPQDNDRRYMRLYVDYGTLISILNGVVDVSDFVLPDDAKVIHVSDDPRCAGLCIIVESATYEPVAYGAEVPPVHSFAMRVRERASKD